MLMWMFPLAMLIGQQGLRLLQNASQFVPVPALGVAAALALSILNIVQVKFMRAL
jgi:hypothetical protein